MKSLSIGLVFLILISVLLGVSFSVLTVHVIPHSHNDVGWLLTTNQYFDRSVRHILDAVVGNLYKNPTRKFTWVETKFFSMWWKFTTSQNKEMFQVILTRNQWEFILGFWCMSDEATPTFTAIINQATLGHRWLKDTFNITPTVGWQIDPFGYSATIPTLFNLIGFTNHAIVRVDGIVKDRLRQTQNLQFLWQPERSNRTLVMPTTILYNHYNPPPGFKWEPSFPGIHANPDQNPSITAENVDARSTVLSVEMKKWATGYRSNHVILPLGDDFTHFNSYYYPGNMTLIMNHVNQNVDRFGVIYKFSLLSEFMASINKEREMSYPLGTGKQQTAQEQQMVKTDDFYPYGDSPNAQWTGYFSSYPNIKETARFGERIARTAEILGVFSSLEAGRQPNNLEKLMPLREANAEMQHHDAVTGTAKTFVRDDYVNNINSGVKFADEISTTALQTIIKLENNNQDSTVSRGYILTQQNKPSLLIYNSLGWRRKELVTVMTTFPIGKIDGAEGDNIKFDIMQLCGTVGEPCWRIFFISTVDPLGYNIYRFTSSNAKTSTNMTFDIHKLTDPKKKTVISPNKSLSLHFCGPSLCQWNIKGMAPLNITQHYFSYVPHSGSPGQPSNQKSGAYIFRPMNNEANSLPPPETTIYQGSVITISMQKFSTFVEQNITILNDDAVSSDPEVMNHMHLDIQTGILPQNTELVTRFMHDLTKPDIFTDNNGFLMFKRQFRDGLAEPIAGNYYPLVYGAYLNESKVGNPGARQLNILTNSTIAFGLLKSGNVELMIHRRTAYDDSRGVGEALDDTRIGHINLKLALDSVDNAGSIRHNMSYCQNYPLELFTVSGDFMNLRRKYSSVSRELPKNVHLLTLEEETRNSKNFVFRLMHIFEKDEFPEHLTANVSVNVVNWMNKFKVNQFNSVSLNAMKQYGAKNPTQVELQAHDIKTFEIQLSK